MATWLYKATPALATGADTVRFAFEKHVISRTARNVNGALISNVGNLAVGDVVLLAYMGGTNAGIKAVARIAPPLGAPVAGTAVIDRIVDPGALADFRRANFNLPPPEQGQAVAHVIRLVDVRPCEAPIRGTYRGNTTIRHAQAADVAQAVRCLGDGDDADEPTAPEPQSAPEPPPSVPPRRAAPPASPASADFPRLPGGHRSLFDRYLMVDWSASATPRQLGPDSIWIADARWDADGRLVEAPAQHAPTRQAALEILLERLAENEEERVLVGFDFAFGYPAGFAQAAGLAAQGMAPWQATLAWMGANVGDDVGNHPNQHTRDATASALNATIDGGGPGPFWGCPAGGQSPTLTSHRVGVFAFPYAGLEEWRVTDARARLHTTTQSVWKLNCGVSVGGQTLMGLHRLHQLHAALPARARIWPFQTGWVVDAAPGRVVLAEIFPSLVPADPTVVANYRDEEQVITCVRRAARLDAAAALDAEFARPGNLDAADENRVLTEEGWMLFLPHA